MKITGVLLKKRGNERVREKVLQPKSMLMPTENSRPEAWAEEWYTTYKPDADSCSRSALSSRSGGSSFDTHSTSSSALYSQGYSKTSSRYDYSYSASSGSSASWLEPPECGTLLNVKPNIGERVTRIHPDYTTSIRRSRDPFIYFEA